MFTYKMASSEDPIEVQIFVWLNKTFGRFAISTVEGCSVFHQEILKPFPPNQ